MDKISPVIRNNTDKRPLYVLIYDKLFFLINDGYFKRGEKLPGENMLAQQLGVSRGSLRQALLILQEDGIINNIQGKGNFVAKDNKVIAQGLEKLGGIVAAFSKSDYQITGVKLAYETPNEFLQEALQVNSSILLVTLHRNYQVEQEYSCYAFSIIPYDRLSCYGLDLNKPNDLVDFLDNIIYQKVSNSFLKTATTSAGNFIAGKLQIAENDKLIVFEEHMYLSNGEPIVYSKFYFRPEFFKFCLNRR